jgi:protein phosphatase
VNFNDILLLAPDMFPPLSATVHAEFAARSWRSPANDVNSDHYLVARLGRSEETLLTSLPADSITKRFEEQAYGIVVADGVGRAGELASRLTVSALLQLALRYGRWQLRVDELVAPEIVERLTHFYRQIDSALIAVNRDDNVPPLHTTLTAIVSAGPDLFFAHVGHSRAYLFRDTDVIQLTRDHTRELLKLETVARLIDLTNVASDLHHILTDALGAGTVDPRIDVERFTLVHDDFVLVCTNGLTDALSDRQIADIVCSARSLDEKAAALVDTAIQRGANDDTTVVLAHYQIPA